MNPFQAIHILIDIELRAVFGADGSRLGGHCFVAAFYVGLLYFVARHTRLGYLLYGYFAEVPL